MLSALTKTKSGRLPGVAQGDLPLRPRAERQTEVFPKRSRCLSSIIIAVVAGSFGVSPVCASATQLAGLFWSDKWLGFYYPNKSDLTEYTKSGSLSSIEECRAWINDQRASRNAVPGADDYECGLNCKAMQGTDMMMCDRTER